MRIAFLTFEFPDIRPGGVGSYVLKCARGLADAGHDPHIFTLPISATVRQNLPVNVQVHDVPDIAQRVEAGTLPPALGAAAMTDNQAAYKLLVATLLCDALRTEHAKMPFDIVEAAEWEGLALPLLLRPIANLPVVVQIHLGLAVNSLGNFVEQSNRDHLAEAVEQASILGADALCAATQNVVEVTKSVLPFHRPVEIIPHSSGIAVSGEYVPAPAEGAALFVGRLHRRKGCDVLAAAADIFLWRNPDATLRLAGSDTKLPADGSSMLAAMTDQIDPSRRDRFVYLGELSQSEVRREIRDCRFQVIPSVVENFANTAIDAMAMGRLVIYGGNTGLDEVVGEAGLRVWPLEAQGLAEKMEAAWRDPSLAQEYGERARARVASRFNALTVSVQRVTFFEKVIAAHRASPDRPRDWAALSTAQSQAILGALISHMSSSVGIESDRPTPGQALTTHLKALSQRLGRPPKVWLFGAGRYTMRLLGERYRWEAQGLTIEGVIDDHPRFDQSATYMGLPVKKPGALLAEATNGTVIDAIILSTDTLEDVFRQRTRGFAELGVPILTL
jgi:glycosyltransferase involved in cell wall biosynthesis